MELTAINHMVFYFRVSRRSQMHGLENQRAHSKQFLKELRKEFSIRPKVTELQEVSRHYRLETRDRLKRAMDLSRKPDTVVVVFAGTPDGNGDNPITRLTRNPALLQEWLDSRCKIINGMSPEDTPQDHMRAVLKAQRTENRKTKSIRKGMKQYQVGQGRLKMSEGQLAARMKGALANRRLAKKAWGKKLVSIRIHVALSQNDNHAAHMLNKSGIRTPKSAKITPTQLARLRRRGLLPARNPF